MNNKDEGIVLGDFLLMMREEFQTLYPWNEVPLCQLESNSTDDLGFKDI